ncbi:MAG TPA: efflux RND transporter periplasmic adaptor subunit, partial [Candidatus Binatia bacterium]|nr:efflux RND transporter periplasmic adaptor subunit [Candidatus Binatia bacterium]
MKQPVSQLISIMLGVAALVTIGLIAFATKPWSGFPGNDEIEVVIAEVKLESRPIVFRISGELQPANVVDVVSRVAGRLTEVKFKTGDTVSAGKIVATVYSGALSERMRSVEAELKATRKQLQVREQQAADADQQVARYKELYRQDLIARRDVEQVEIQAATARAELELVRAQIAQAQAMLTQTSKLQQLARIVAPISGAVTGALSAGDPVTEARTIITIARIDALKLVVAVPASYVALVHEGMAVRVSPKEGSAEVHHGEVVRIRRDIKTSDMEMPIEIRIDNRDRALQLGARVNATLSLNSQEQLPTIPRSALQSVADQYYVFQIVNNRAARRRVE